MKRLKLHCVHKGLYIDLFSEEAILKRFGTISKLLLSSHHELHKDKNHTCSSEYLACAPCAHDAKYAPFYMSLFYSTSSEESLNDPNLTKDMEKAVELLEKSASMDRLCPPLLNYLGTLYDEDSPYKVTDMKKALYYYLKAAGEKYKKAQFNLAELYITGIDGLLEKNPEKAAIFFQLVVDDNMYLEVKDVALGETFKILHGIGESTMATVNLARISLWHMSCKVPRPNVSQPACLKVAMYHLVNAAKAGYAEAQTIMGDIFTQGLYGFPQSEVVAKEWMNHALGKKSTPCPSDGKNASNVRVIVDIPTTHVTSLIAKKDKLSKEDLEVKSKSYFPVSDISEGDASEEEDVVYKLYRQQSAAADAIAIAPLALEGVLKTDKDLIMEFGLFSKTAAAYSVVIDAFTSSIDMLITTDFQAEKGLSLLVDSACLNMEIYETFWSGIEQKTENKKTLAFQQLVSREEKKNNANAIFLKHERFIHTCVTSNNCKQHESREGCKLESWTSGLHKLKKQFKRSKKTERLKDMIAYFCVKIGNYYMRKGSIGQAAKFLTQGPHAEWVDFNARMNFVITELDFHLKSKNNVNRELAYLTSMLDVRLGIMSYCNPYYATTLYHKAKIRFIINLEWKGVFQKAEEAEKRSLNFLATEDCEAKHFLRNKLGKCSHCDTRESLDKNLLQCPCHDVQYCNKKCQQSHWANHKTSCTNKERKAKGKKSQTVEAQNSKDPEVSSTSSSDDDVKVTTVKKTKGRKSPTLQVKDRKVTTTDSSDDAAISQTKQTLDEAKATTVKKAKGRKSPRVQPEHSTNPDMSQPRSSDEDIKAIETHPLDEINVMEVKDRKSPTAQCNDSKEPRIGTTSSFDKDVTLDQTEHALASVEMKKVSTLMCSDHATEKIDGVKVIELKTEDSLDVKAMCLDETTKKLDDLKITSHEDKGKDRNSPDINMPCATTDSSDDSELESVPGECSLCNKQIVKPEACPCAVTIYCSRLCKKRHWKQHKNMCSYVYVCSYCELKAALGVKLKRCPCRDVSYCNKICQQNHWSQHQLTCKLYKTPNSTLADVD